MASTKEYLDFVLDQLDGLEGIRTRPMMGEYVLYCGGKVVGGIYDDRLLLKPTPAALRLMEEAGLDVQRELPYEGAKEMILADVDRRELLQETVRAIADELPAGKRKRSKAKAEENGMKLEAMREEHREEVTAMMRVFYASPAVSTNGSAEIFRADIDACLGDSPYLEGYVLTEDKRLLGYAMLAKSFSTEFGKPCIWIEDLYLKPEYREQGLGSEALEAIRELHPEALLRLEVERENSRAVHVYRKCGYGELPYLEMLR